MKKLPLIRHSIDEESKKILFAFDLDDTLIRTHSNIIVHNGDQVRTLTPSQYSTYEPKQGDKFNFKEFDNLINPEIIKDTFQLFSKVLRLTKRLPNSKTIILTARPPSIEADLQNFLKNQGLTEVELYAVDSSNPGKKANVIQDFIDQGYLTIRFYDDSPKNIAAIKSLKATNPKVDIQAKLVNQELAETIRKVGDKYAVYPEKKGKRLGTHDTRKEAEKQLAAIHIQQHNEEVGGVNTSWSDDTDTVTLQDILDLTKNIKIVNYPTEKLAKIVLNWDNNPKEIERINQVEVSKQYPILIMVDENEEIKWILDGNHRAQKALKSNIKTIPAKLIKPSDLDYKAKKILLGITEIKKQLQAIHIQQHNEGKYDDTSKFDLVKNNPFDIKKLVDKGIIFLTKPGDGKGGVEEPNWEGDASILTLYNIQKPDPWMKIAIKSLLPKSIPYIQKDQDKLLYNGKYNQILWSIDKKGLNPEEFFLKENLHQIKYTQPNFEFEWEEASRYPEFKEMGKEGWIEVAKKGKPIKFSLIKSKLGNVDLHFDSLEEPKKQRFSKAFQSNKVETPIAVKFSNTDYDLIAGNTRLSGLVKNGVDPYIWIVDISNIIESKHEPMNPGILKKRLGKLSCSKVRAERAKLKDKGTTYAKALQRYLNYHCKD